MKDKAGSMGAGMAWGFAIGSVVVATILGFIGVHGFVGTVLNILIYMAGGYAAVFMTKASTGKGILAFLVAGIISGIASFICVGGCLDWAFAVQDQSYSVVHDRTLAVNGAGPVFWPGRAMPTATH